MSRHELPLSPAEQIYRKFKRPEKVWNRQYGDTDLSYFDHIFKEQHHHNCNNCATYSINGFKGKELIFLTGYVHLKNHDVVNAEHVNQARLKAAKALLTGKVDRVTITYGDSDNVATNSRNAPLDGNAAHLYQNHPEIQALPKKDYPEPLPNTYDWEPLTDEVRMSVFSSAIAQLQIENRSLKPLRKKLFNNTRRSSRQLKHRLRIEQTLEAEKQQHKTESITELPLPIPIATTSEQSMAEWQAELPESSQNSAQFYQQHRAAHHYSASTPDYYPDAGKSTHPDYLREVTVDAGTYQRRAYLLNEPDSHGFRIIQEQQIDGSYSEGMVHTSRIKNTLLPSNRTFIDQKDPLAGYFPERTVEETFTPIELPLCLPIINETARLEIDHN